MSETGTTFRVDVPWPVSVSFRKKGTYIGLAVCTDVVRTLLANTALSTHTSYRCTASVRQAQGSREKVIEENTQAFIILP